MPEAARTSPHRTARKAAPPPRGAAVRLREALTALTQEPNTKITIAELCRRADVSRNSLYRYHGKILESFRRLPKSNNRAAQRTRLDTVGRLRGENAALRKQLTQVAALVDHFYAAYQESQLLLKRRDRELADVRRSLKAMPQLIR